ncbi:MAG: hypothetical protein AAFO69_03430 [Bacteroidota bacterium]
MKELTTIGFIAAASLLLFGWRNKPATCHCAHCNCSGEPNSNSDKVHTNQAKPKTTQISKKAQPTSRPLDEDLKKWGTQEQIIDVAELSPTKVYQQQASAKQLHLNRFQIPSQLDDRTPYEADLQKWGTTQGVIDVANDQAKKKKDTQKVATIKQIANEVRSTYLAGKKRELLAKGKVIETAQDLLDAMERDLQTTQFTMANTSDQTRTVTLWNANRSTSVSPPLPTDVADHELKASHAVVNAVHQQGAVINPKNSLVYTVGQLSDNVLVYDLNGNFIREVKLTNSLMPGSVSPVDLVVDTDASSAYHGNVYVVGSVSNQIYELTTDFQVNRTFDATRRPLAIALNPTSGELMVTSHTDNTVAVIDRVSNTSSTYPTGSSPQGIAFDQTGQTFIANSGANNLTVYNQDFSATSTIDHLTGSPSRLLYHPALGKIYVTAPQANRVKVIDTNGLTIENTIEVESKPFAIGLNPNNGFVYVANSDSSSISIIDQAQTIETLQNVSSDTGLAFSNTSDLFITTSLNTLHSIGFQNQSSSIEIDDELMERAVEFQNQPVKIAAAKMIVTGNSVLRTLRLRKQTYTGTVTESSVSLTSARSPQNLEGTINIDGLEGAFIDGANGWDLELAPGQRITMLLTYRQLDPYHLFPTSTNLFNQSMSSKSIPL